MSLGLTPRASGAVTPSSLFGSAVTLAVQQKRSGDWLTEKWHIAPVSSSGAVLVAVCADRHGHLSHQGGDLDDRRSRCGDDRVDEIQRQVGGSAACWFLVVRRNGTTPTPRRPQEAAAANRDSTGGVGPRLSVLTGGQVADWVIRPSAQASLTLVRCEAGCGTNVEPSTTGRARER